MTDAVDLADLIRSTPARNPGQASAEAVLEATAHLFHVTTTDLAGPSRTRTMVDARQVAMAVLRANTTMSYPEIGHLLNRDHTTVVSSVQRVARTPALLAWASAVDLELHRPVPPLQRRRSACHRNDGGRT